MGNSESQTTSLKEEKYTTMGSFDPQAYMGREGISRADVIHIRHAFESLRDDERHEHIRLARLRELPIFTKQDISLLQGQIHQPYQEGRNGTFGDDLTNRGTYAENPNRFKMRVESGGVDCVMCGCS